MEKKKLFEDFPPVDVSTWEEKIREDLKGADYEKKLIWKSPEGIAVKPYYTAGAESESSAGAVPGCYPYVRGYEADAKSWIINQEIEVTDIVQANKKALEALKGGAGSLTFKISHLAYREEMQQLLEGIDIANVPLHFTSSFSYSILAELLSEEIRRRSAAVGEVQGSFNFDSIAWYILHGEFYNSREDNFNEAATLIRMCEDALPSFRIITVNGQHFHNAGATAVQELAFTMASASEYLAAMDDLGIKPGLSAKKMTLCFAVGSSYFMEIAKFRAARLLWSMLTDAYGIKDEKAQKVPVTAVSSLWNKTVYDPWVNQLRLTTEAMSAAIGGSSEICLQPYSKAFKENDETGDRLSRNIQHLLREESHLGAVLDPAAGSYYIEELTTALAKNAWELFLEIEKQGGLIAFTASGKLQEMISGSCSKRDMDIATRKTSVLGTNIFPNMNENMLEQLELKVQPRYEGLKIYRGAEAFEEIRLATENHVKQGKKRPSVKMLTFGNLAMRKARATFSANFFGCAGYEITDETEVLTLNEPLQLISGADIIVVCSSDDEYAEMGMELVRALKSVRNDIRIVVAGNPASAEELRKAGVDDFIHVRTNILDFLKRYQQEFGIL